MGTTERGLEVQSTGDDMEQFGRVIGWAMSRQIAVTLKSEGEDGVTEAFLTDHNDEQIPLRPGDTLLAWKHSDGRWILNTIDSGTAYKSGLVEQAI